MPLVDVQQGTAEWLAARSGKITASIAAACLGAHPHMSRQEAWRQVLGTAKDKSNKHTNWGTEYEPRAREDYEIVTGNFVVETGFWVHPVYEWLGASPDGFIGTARGLELKCPSKCPTALAGYHRIQCIVNMLCTGRKEWDYFVWVPGNGHYLQTIRLNGEAPGLVRRLREFYDLYVLTNTEPPRKKARRATQKKPQEVF